MAGLGPTRITFRGEDANGDPLANGTLETYEAGTSTPKTTYTDSSEATENSNPIVLDSDGKCDLWLGEGAYKLILKDSSGSTIDTIDDVTSDALGGLGDADFTISANTSITSAYDKAFITTTSTPTLSLESAASLGASFSFIVKSDGTTTIDPDGSETINGSATLTLNSGEWAIIFSDGTNWSALKYGFVNEFSDSAFRIQDNSDATKELAFEVSGITTGTTRTVTAPDKSGTMAMTSDLVVVQNHITGLTLSNDTDTDHDINVTAGQAADSTNTQYLTLSSEITKQIDASWSVGDNAGGLSSSLTVANNTTYHVFLIVVSGSVDVGFDTSLTASNLVTDHSATAYRRIGSVMTDGSANIIQFTQLGDDFLLDTPINSATYTGSAAINTTTSTALAVPTGIQVIAQINGIADVGTNSFWNAYISSLDQADTAPSLSTTPLSNLCGSNQTGHSSPNELLVKTNTSGQIRVRGTGAGASDVLRIDTIGWKDTRGR